MTLSCLQSFLIRLSSLCSRAVRRVLCFMINPDPVPLCVLPTQRSLLWPMMVCAGAERLRWSGPPNEREDDMKLITQFELARMSKPELQALFRTVSGAAETCSRGSRDRINALASLHNIRRELAMRFPKL